MALINYRIVVMGSGGVGKTSLITQFIKGKFGSAYFPTIENTYNHTITMSDGVSYNIELVDTAGLYIVPAKRQFNIRSGKAFILVYDVTNILSFLNALDLADDVTHAKGAKRTPMILVGSKLDLNADREVAASDGQDEANKRNCAFMETSCKDNESVTAVFTELLERIFPVKGRVYGKGMGKMSLIMKLSGQGRNSTDANTKPELMKPDRVPNGLIRVNEKVIKGNLMKWEGGSHGKDGIVDAKWDKTNGEQGSEKTIERGEKKSEDGGKEKGEEGHEKTEKEGKKARKCSIM